MNLKRNLFVIPLCLILMVVLTSCYSSISFTFKVPNGENIKITLDTTDGYKLVLGEFNLSVRKDDEDILMGAFFKCQGI